MDVSDFLVTIAAGVCCGGAARLSVGRVVR